MSLRNSLTIAIILFSLLEANASDVTTDQIAECREDAREIRDTLNSYAHQTHGTPASQTDIRERLQVLKDVSQKIRKLDSKLERYGVSEKAAWADRHKNVSSYMKASREAVNNAWVQGLSESDTSSESEFGKGMTGHSSESNQVPCGNESQSFSSRLSKLVSSHTETTDTNRTNVAIFFLAVCGGLVYLVSRIIAADQVGAKKKAS